MSYITFNYHNASDFIEREEWGSFYSTVDKIHQKLHNGSGAGNGSLGWVELSHDTNELERIRIVAEKIQQNSDVLLVIGVGGSYLGAKAAIELLHHSFRDLFPEEERRAPHVIFAGHNISSTYKQELLSVLKDKDVSINVISKSGTTTEPAMAFRVFRDFLEEKYGKEEASKRIYATTDEEKGPLKKLADIEGYETFIIPDDIGGRYSVLTPVGLLPMAVSGVSIHEVLAGARDAIENLKESELSKNPAYQYAVLRNILYKKGYMIEILASFEPKLQSFADWWVQLFGESEGKDRKGIFPTTAHFSTDLHSFGQYIQDGHRKLFETVIKVESSEEDLIIDRDARNIDGLNYLSGKSLREINAIACEASILAHTEGGVPNLEINIPTLDAYTFGYMVYFFKKACAMSGHLLGVNPFDQPGVESYKCNMFALLGKPGYEKRREELEKRMGLRKM